MLGRRLPRRTPSQRVALEIDDLLSRLDHEAPYLESYWNQYRDSSAMLAALANPWRTLPPDLLLALEPDELVAATAFFEEVARFALWLRTTEVMPATLGARLEAALVRLHGLGDVALDALGGVPDRTPPSMVPPGWGSLVR